MSVVNSTAQQIHAKFQLNYSATIERNGSDNSAYHLSVDISLPGQGITAIWGHSGSGKTSLLRCIAGLTQAEVGELTVNGDCWQSADIFVPTYLRPLGYVFQEASLFEHLTAQGNLAYAIKRSHQPYSDDFYQQVISIMGISDLLAHYPSQLSGGERQRVAIARALLMQAKLLLMDEPLASLDDDRKQEILPYLERLRSHFKLPIIYVSHSLDEVARLADHVVVLEQGQVVSQGPVFDVFAKLNSPLRFEQEAGVVLQGQVIGHDPKWQLMHVACAGGELCLPEVEVNQALSQQSDHTDNNSEIRVRVLAKDVSLTLSEHQDSSILNRLAVTVEEIEYNPEQALALVKLKAGRDYMLARLTRRSVAHLQLTPGQQLWAQIKSVAIVR